MSTVNPRKKAILERMGEISAAKKVLTVERQKLYAEYQSIAAQEKLSKLTPEAFAELQARAEAVQQ